MQGQLKMTKREEDKELKQYEAMIRKIASEFNLKYNNKYDIEDLQQAARLAQRVEVLHSPKTQCHNVKIIEFVRIVNI